MCITAVEEVQYLNVEEYLKGLSLHRGATGIIYQDMKERDSTVDIIKAIGIVCMVLGHSGCPITHFICLFHMAIFFIASGYCYKENYSNDLKSVAGFIKRKIITLWFPFVLWTAIYSLLHNFFIKINVYTDNPLLLEHLSGEYIELMPYWSVMDIVKNILKAILLHGGTQMGGAFWFLATLMEVSVCYCIVDFLLHYLFKHNEKKICLFQWIVSIGFLMAGYYCYKIERSFAGVDKIFSFYILFHGGLFLRKYGYSSKERKGLVHVVILSVAFIILLVCNKYGSISLVKNSYVNPLYFLIVSFIGWQFLYEIAFFMGKVSIIRKAFVYLGQNTLSLVIFHFLSFKIVSYIGVLIKGQPLCLVAAFPILYEGGAWWIAYTLVGILVPIGLNALWKKLKNKICRTFVLFTMIR